MPKKDFMTLLITMIVGGLTYSIISFSYMHSKFATIETTASQDKRMDRSESRVWDKLGDIEKKLDRLIERGNNR